MSVSPQGSVHTATASAYNRLPSLTGLRFVAAFFVFGFHIGTTHLFNDSGLSRATEFMFRQGATGVSFFFILSGFVLTWSARPGDTARRFWRRRAAKIYPDHLVTAVMALAALVAFGGTVSTVAVVCNLLLVQAWVPHQPVFFGLNTPSWSLSCEAFFYLCFPLLLRAVQRLRVRWLWPVTILALASVCLMPALALVLPAGQRYWFVFVWPPVRMLEFLIGMLLARIVRVGLWIPLGAVPAAALAIAGYVGSGYLPGGFSYIAGTVVPLALLIPAVATTDLRETYSALRSRAMVWLGEVSFAFYLLHQLVIRFVDKALGSKAWTALGGVCVIVAMLALSLAASWLLYRVVERPLMDRLAGRRAAPTPAATQEVAPARAS